MNGLSEILGIFFTIMGTVVSISDNRLLKRFMKNKAFDENSSIGLGKLNFLQNRRLQKYIKTGVILYNKIKDQYYLNENKFKEYKQARRKRVLTLIIILLALFAILYFL